MADYQSQVGRQRLLLIMLIGLLPVSLFIALVTGSVSISWPDIWSAFSGESSINQTLIMDLRLPRAISAMVTGAMLALAGVLMQVLLRNPLADPYILGISGGAATGALLSMLLGVSGYWLTGSALLGALLSMFIVFGLAHGRGSWTTTRLLLTGVVVATGWGALISFMLAIAPEHGVFGMLFWLMGDLGQTEMPVVGIAVIVIGLMIGIWMARNLNVLARGEMQASALGVPVKKLRLQIYFLASLLTATAVTIAGSIGFVGLIVPHMLRLVIGNDHRILIPASAVAGAILLVLADVIARSIIAPQQLPVGIITAMLGVPVFLYLLHRSHRS